MSDWYESCKQGMFEYVAETTGVEELKVRLIYSELEQLGLIDYDIEKEVLAEIFGDGDDEDE